MAKNDVEAPPLPDIVGSSPAMQEVYRLTKLAAPTNASVIIIGETGTGKEVIAKAIHKLSRRSDGPYIRVNCGALHENLLESELFGHVKGAFTGAIDNKTGRFEAAHNGTIFLDEISSMSFRLQVKLLRVLQEREFERVGESRTIRVDVRVVAATNQSLEEEIAAGRFRDDLFYRLNVVPIPLPPLRERRDDIPVLIDLFLHRSAQSRNEPVKHVSADALEVLKSFAWPGNVRELENALERAVILTTGDVIDVSVLPERLTQRRSEPLISERPASNPTLDAIERAYIMWVLQSEGGNKTRAAEVLGIDPS